MSSYPYSLNSSLATDKFEVLLALIIMGGVAAAFTGAKYETYLKISTRNALTLAAAAWALCGTLILYQTVTNRELFQWSLTWRLMSSGVLPMVASRGLIAVFAAPFIVKLYRAWVGGFVSEAEKTPGMDGVRGWLAVDNLVCVLGISLAAWQGYGCSFWGALLITLLALLAYPTLNMLSSQPPRPAAAPRATTENLAPERERVLRMLEEGKIDADESAELLSALGETVQPPPSPVTVTTTPGRKLALLGAAIVTMGFFLPWFSIDLGKEMQRMIHETGMVPQQIMQEQMNPGQGIQTDMGAVHLPWPRPPQFNGVVNVAGGDIANGLGWFILLLAAGAAVLPYVATGLKTDAQRNITYGALAIGSLLLAYLLTRSIQYATFGVAVIVAGYAASWIGAIREYRGYNEPAPRVVTS